MALPTSTNEFAVEPCIAQNEARDMMRVATVACKCIVQLRAFHRAKRIEYLNTTLYTPILTQPNHAPRRADAHNESGAGPLSVASAASGRVSQIRIVPSTEPVAYTLPLPVGAKATELIGPW
jgi:hypothetical protein